MPAGLKETYNLSWIPWIYFEHWLTMFLMVANHIFEL